MKKIKIIGSLLLLFTAISFTSCENEPIDSAIDLDDFGGNNGGNGNNNGVFKVDIDGVTFTASTINATKISQPFSIYQIAGIATAGGVTKSVMIQIKDNGTNNYLTGTGPNGPEDAEIGYFPNVLEPDTVYTSDDFDDIDNSTGSLTITANDIVSKKISGTFNCTVYLLNPDDGSVVGSKTLSNGVFTDVTYTLTN